MLARTSTRPATRLAVASTQASHLRSARPAAAAARDEAPPSSSAAASAALTLGLLATMAALEPGFAHAAPDVAQQHGGPALSELAESSDFWANVARYASFFFSVLLGTAATAVKPVVVALRKSPASAAGVLAVAGLTLWAVSSTVSLMLGVGEGGSGPDDLAAFLDSGL